MRVIFLGVAVALMVAWGGNSLAQQSSPITLDQVERMFADMRTKPEYKKWDIDGELLWGYYFTDPDPKKLRPLADHLSNNGYHFVGIYPDDEGKIFFLHVERVEYHTPQSLNQRNQEFYKLARQFKLISYDGMDVGRISK